MLAQVCNTVVIGKLEKYNIVLHLIQITLYDKNIKGGHLVPLMHNKVVLLYAHYIGYLVYLLCAPLFIYYHVPLFAHPWSAADIF